MFAKFPHLLFAAACTSVLVLGGFGFFDLRSAGDILNLQNFLAGELNELEVEYEKVDLETGSITPLLEASARDLEADGPVGGTEPEPVIIERTNLLSEEAQAEIAAEAASETVELPPVEVVPGLETEVEPDLPRGGAAPEEDQEELQEDYFGEKRGDFETQRDAYKI